MKREMGIKENGDYRYTIMYQRASAVICICQSCYILEREITRKKRRIHKHDDSTRINQSGKLRKEQRLKEQQCFIKKLVLL